jgi:hypothetical protein
MGKGQLTLKSVTTDYQYQNENLVQGCIKRNAETGAVMEHRGCVGKPREDGSMGEIIGNFYGAQRGEKLKYSFNEMTLDNIDVVKAAIREVEPLLLPIKEEEND